VTVNFNLWSCLRIWPRWPRLCQIEAACRISRSKVIQFKNYCPDTHSHIGPIALSGLLEWSVKQRMRRRRIRWSCYSGERRIRCVWWSPAVAVRPHGIARPMKILYQVSYTLHDGWQRQPSATVTVKCCKWSRVFGIIDHSQTVTLSSTRHLCAMKKLKIGAVHKISSKVTDRPQKCRCFLRENTLNSWNDLDGYSTSSTLVLSDSNI